jgi:hypothetical protein
MPYWTRQNRVFWALKQQKRRRARLAESDPILALFANGQQGVYFDPRDLSTSPGAGSGDSVATRLDKSGNGASLTQADSAKRPALENAGGLWSENYDGVDDFMGGQYGFVLSQPYTTVIVAEFVSGLIPIDSAGLSENDGNRRFLLADSGRTRINAGSNLEWGTGVRGTKALLILEFNGASSTIENNGSVVATGDAGNSSISSLRLGGNAGEPPSAHAEFKLFGFVERAGLLTSSEKELVRSEFAARAGIAL